MPTRNISLTEQFDRFVEDNVSSGEYQNASEVVRDGLRLLQQRKREETLKLRELRRAAREGFAQIDRGDYIDVHPRDLADFFVSLRKRSKSRGAK
jgi:antitoxin ParD1/3/4